MARRGGLGRGLDSLIPNRGGSEKKNSGDNTEKEPTKKKKTSGTKARKKTAPVINKDNDKEEPVVTEIETVINADEASDEPEEVEYVYVDEDGNPVDINENSDDYVFVDENGNPILENAAEADANEVEYIEVDESSADDESDESEESEETDDPEAADATEAADSTEATDDMEAVAGTNDIAGSQETDDSSHAVNTGLETGEKLTSAASADFSEDSAPTETTSEKSDTNGVDGNVEETTKSSHVDRSEEHVSIEITEQSPENSAIIHNGGENVDNVASPDTDRTSGIDTDINRTYVHNVDTDFSMADDSASELSVNESSFEDKKDGDVISMRISLVEPNRDQPRKYFDDAAISELADSVRQFGVIQPLLVQKKDGYYEIIAGERRWRAAKKAGLKEVPVIVKNFSGQEAVEVSLIENIQREDLNPIEEAKAYERLVHDFGMSQEEVAGRVSKSRSAVTNSMRLLKLGEDIQRMVENGSISEGHARAILGVSDQELQKKIADQIVAQKLSVRQTEKLVRELTSSSAKKEKAVNEAREAIIHDISEKLKTALGTKVSIRDNGKRGKIEIEYYSDDELERIFDLIRSAQ